MEAVPYTHTPFWIPLWLCRPSLCDTHGQPNFRLKAYFRLQLWSIFLFIPGIFIICFAIIGIWPAIDETCVQRSCRAPTPARSKPIPTSSALGAGTDLVFLTEEPYNIQVRIATYVQTVCNILVLGFSSSTDRANAVYGTLVLISLSTVITVVVFSARGELSLQHAAASTSLLNVTIFPMVILDHRRVRSPGIFVAQQVQMVLYLGVRLWLTIQMPCLGSTPECNLCTRTSLAGVPSHLSTPTNRSFRLAFSVLVAYFWLRTLLWVYGPPHHVQAVPAMFSERRRRTWTDYIKASKDSVTLWHHKEPERLKSENIRPWMTLFWIWYGDDRDHRTVAEWARQQTQSRGGRPVRTPKTWPGRVWADAGIAARTPRCQRAFCALLWSAVLMLDTELSIKYNISATRDEWGYGQIFALVSTLPALSAATKLVLQLGKRDDVSVI